LQSSYLVYGVEADIQGSSDAGADQHLRLANTGTGFLPFDAHETTDLHTFGTVRGRLGVLATPTLLAYVTGGFAYGSVERSYTNNFINAAGAAFAQTGGSVTRTETGWTVGGGLEWALAAVRPLEPSTCT
jgi:opacity protein-like surface antigen